MIEVTKNNQGTILIQVDTKAYVHIYRDGKRTLGIYRSVSVEVNNSSEPLYEEIIKTQAATAIAACALREYERDQDSFLEKYEIQ